MIILYVHESYVIASRLNDIYLFDFSSYVLIPLLRVPLTAVIFSSHGANKARTIATFLNALECSLLAFLTSMALGFLVNVLF